MGLWNTLYKIQIWHYQFNVCLCNVYIRALQLIKFAPLMFYTSNTHVITKESELHHSIGSPIDGAHPGPKTDRDYLGRYCP